MDKSGEFDNTFITQSECPYLVCRHCPDDIFHILRVESAEPLTIVSTSSQWSTVNTSIKGEIKDPQRSVYQGFCYASLRIHYIIWAT